MARLRYIEELAVDHKCYSWYISVDGKTYLEKVAKDTNGMNMVQFFIYCGLWQKV